jgi:nucleoside 2-deoxyribosyltransferase
VKGYLASYFFDQATFDYTAKIAEAVRRVADIELYVPQENGEINDKEKNDATITAEKIFIADTDELLSSNILICVIDGLSIDDGVACEIGAWSGLNYVRDKYCKCTLPIFALYTDMRKNGTGDNRLYRNLYVKGAIKKYGKIYNSIEELAEGVKAYVDSIEKVSENVD